MNSSCLPSTMSCDHNTNAELHRFRSSLAKVRAYQQNEYEVALCRHIEKEREKRRREHRRQLDSPSQSKQGYLNVGFVLEQRPRSSLNPSAPAAAALAAEKRASRAAREAADSVALVPWDSDRHALSVFKNQIGKSSCSVLPSSPSPSPTPTPTPTPTPPVNATCQLPNSYSAPASGSPSPFPIPPESKRCISPRALRLAKEFTIEAREYERRRQRVQRMNALANGLPFRAKVEISRGRTPRPTVHRPTASFASPVTVKKPRRRENECGEAGGHRLGGLADFNMQGKPDLSNVPWVHRRHAEASTRTFGRMPTLTRNSPSGSLSSVPKIVDQASPPRVHRRVQNQSTVCTPHAATPTHNNVRTSEQNCPSKQTKQVKQSKQNQSGCAANRTFAARPAVKNNRNYFASSHCPTANRTFPKMLDAVEIPTFDDEEVEAAPPAGTVHLPIA